MVGSATAERAIALLRTIRHVDRATSTIGLTLDSGGQPVVDMEKEHSLRVRIVEARATGSSTGTRQVNCCGHSHP